MMGCGRSQCSTLTRAVSLAAFSAGLFLFFAGDVTAQLLSSADTAIPIDTDAVLVGAMLNGRFPSAENPGNLFDADPGTKYLNFGRDGSGFIVSPTLAGIPVDAFQMTTANDASGRDPATWALYGFNGALTTVDSGPDPAINPDGLAEAWTLISSGSVALPDDRLMAGPVVNVGSTTGYDHYKMIFPTTKSNTECCMQLADIQFLASGSDPASGFLLPGDPVIAVDETPTPPGWSGSSTPGAETAPMAIDRLSSTKYLNFGQQGSGLIITNSDGPARVNYMRLTTANDAVARDPASYELYGTNDAVQSVPNSNGLGGENWTLISSGSLSLPDARFDASTVVAINSPADYKSYKLVFPTVKDAASANSMQIADVQFATQLIPEPSALALVALALVGAVAARRRV